MTRKHFIAMAKIIAAMKDRAEAQTVADAFATLAKQTNANFDRARFFTACNL